MYHDAQGKREESGAGAKRQPGTLYTISNSVKQRGRPWYNLLQIERKAPASEGRRYSSYSSMSIFSLSVAIKKKLMRVWLAPGRVAG